MRACLAVLLLLAASAEAGVDTATLRVRGRNAEDVVSAELAAADGGWRARLEGPREVVFLEVPPGRYALTVAGVTATAALDLAPSETAEVVVEKEALRASPVLAESLVTPFDAEALRSLPSGRDPWSLLETIEPFAVVDRIDTGGLWVGRPAHLSAHGGSWTDTSYRLGGLDVTDPRRGGLPLPLVPLSGLESLSFVSAAAPIDLPGNGSTVVLVPRRPGSRWSGSFRSGLDFGGAAPEPTPPPFARIDSWRDVEAAVGGPVAGGRLGLFLAGAWQRVRRDEWTRGATVDARLASGMLHGVWHASERDEVRLLATSAHVAGPPDAPLFGEAGATDGRLSLASSWERRAAGGSVWRASAGYARVAQAVGPARSVGVDRLVQGTVPEQVAERGGARDRVSLAAAASPAARRAFGGLHRPRLGADAAWTRERADPFEGDVLETIAGEPARASSYASAAETRAHGFEGALWAEDRMIRGRLSIEAGVRADVARERADAAPDAVSWIALSPRVAARVRILGTDALLLRASWRRSAGRPHLDWTEFGDPAAPVAAVSPATGGRSSELRGPGAPAGALDPELHAPRSNEWWVALESHVGRALTVRFAGVERRGRDLVESVQTGVPAAAYETRFLVDPGGDLAHTDDDQLLPVFARTVRGGDRLLLTNVGGDTTRYQGVELTVVLRSEGASLLLAATAHKSEGNAADIGFRATENDPGLVGALFDDPNADTFDYGRLFFDRAYTIKLSGTWRAPKGVRLGAAARYQDGQPFARLVLVSDLPQGPTLVRAVPDGRHRFSYTLTVDARAEKTIALGRARVGAALEAFNLLQTRHEVEEDVLTGPAFRTPTAVQPPRVFRASVLVDF